MNQMITAFIQEEISLENVAYKMLAIHSSFNGLIEKGSLYMDTPL